MRSVLLIVTEAVSDGQQRLRVMGSIQRVGGVMETSLICTDDLGFESADQHVGKRPVLEALQASSLARSLLDELEGVMDRRLNMKTVDRLRSIPLSPPEVPGVQLIPAPVLVAPGLWQYYLPLTQPSLPRQAIRARMPGLKVEDEVYLGHSTKGIGGRETLGVYQDVDGDLILVGYPCSIFGEDLRIGIADTAFDEDFTWLQGDATTAGSTGALVVATQLAPGLHFRPSCGVWSDSSARSFQTLTMRQRQEVF